VGHRASRQYLVNGLMLGSCTAWSRSGFTLFFGVLDRDQVSHGDVLTVGAFTGFASILRQAAGVAAPWLQLMSCRWSRLSRWGAGGADRAFPGAPAAVRACAKYPADDGSCSEPCCARACGCSFPMGRTRSRSRRLPDKAFTFGLFTLRVDSMILLVAGLAMIAGSISSFNRTKLGLASARSRRTAKTARNDGHQLHVRDPDHVSRSARASRPSRA